MARPTRFTSDQLLDAALVVLRRDGPAELSVAAIAREAGAPSGSVYHRFASRDVLVGVLWLRTVERFQDGYLDVLGAHDDPVEAVRAAARHVLRWSREHPAEVALLMLHRSEDLLGGDWPDELVERNRAQRARLVDAARTLARRLPCTDATALRRVVFAAVDVPYAEVRARVAQGQPIDTTSDQLVDETVRAVLAPLTTSEDP